jgi:Uma2 family endonuclease
MLQIKLQLPISIQEPINPIEPVRLPRKDGPWKIEDLEGLADHENSYDLVHGDLYMMTPASPVHGRYITRLVAALHPYVEENNLGEIYTAESGFILQPEPDLTVRAPDVAFVRKDRIPPADQQQGFWPLAPDLVIEIISPSESAESIQEKVQDYLTAGTRLIWLVYPRLRSVVEYRSPSQIRQYNLAETLDAGDVILGFHLRMQTLFRD